VTRRAKLAAVAGWLLLGAVAAAGLALSAVALLAALPFTRPIVASVVIRVVDEAIAGRVELQGISVLPHGGMEVRGVEVYDPDGHLVLQVGRALVFMDVTALRSRIIGLSAELESPTVLLEEEPGGGVSIARAFAPAGGGGAAGRPGEAGGGGGWTLLVSRLVLHGGDLWWQDAAGGTRLEAAGLEVAARGIIGPRRIRAEVRLAGTLGAPVATPISLEAVATLAGDALRVPVLRLEAGGTALDAVGEGDFAQRRGRLAVARLGLSREQARALVPDAPPGADLAAAGYAEADGATLTAALRVEPAGTGGASRRGDAAVAARLGALARAVGFDVALDRIDPSRIAAALPAGEVTLTGRGAMAGARLEDLRGRLSVTIARSRLGGGELSRGELVARATRGAVEVERLSAAVPGGAVEAAGSWRRGGALSGHATVDAPDLARAARNAALLAGEADPRLGGRARLDLTVAGTAEAPTLAGTLDAPTLRAGTAVVDGVQLTLRAAGPGTAPSGEVEGKIGAVRAGGIERARRITLRASLAQGEAALAATATVPAAGSEPISVEGRGALDREAARLELRQLALSSPGSRWTLSRPAAVDLRRGAVDRLELADGPQRLALEGGLGRAGALDARLELWRLDLARLPAGLLPGEPLRGEVSGSVTASGAMARPLVAGRLTLEDGGYGKIGGVSLEVDARFDGATRRASGSASVSRAAGGRIEVEAELPVPLAGRPAEHLRLRLRAEGLPLAELLLAAGVELPLDGVAGADLRVDGTAGAPAAAGEVTLARGVYEDLEELGVTVSLEAPGATARVAVAGTLAGRQVVTAEASAPLDLADLAARPAETVHGLRGAAVQGAVSIRALDLAALSGRAGIPRDLAGVLEAHAEVSGPPAAPRGRLTATLSGGAIGGWRGLGGTVDGTAAATGLAVTGRLTLQGEEALRLSGTLGLRPELLADRAALGAAPLRVEAQIPRIALGRAAGEALPLEGTVEGKITLGGTPRAPVLEADLAGAGVAVKGRPLGDATVKARYASARGDATVTLHPTSGGALRGTLAVRADLGLGAGGPSLPDAPAEATVAAEALDLGFLPALAPGVVRSAGGKVELDARAAGPLRRMSPRGTLRIAGGRLAISELGEWTDVTVEARVTDDAVELSRLEVKRGKGTLSGSAALRGLRGDQAKLTAKLTASAFTVSRAGQELVTLDLEADATGTYGGGELSADVRVPHGTIRLPSRTPRALQPLRARSDITVGRKAELREAASLASAAGTRPLARPLVVRVHAVVPGKLFVKSDDPKIDVELKADVRYEREQSGDYLSGTVEVVRGSLEPIGGRTFVVEHGSVRFTNGPPNAALLDFQARYTNPAAVVTAKVTGTVRAPDLKLSSDPPMNDADIALLLLTGRTEAKPGSGGAVGGLTGEEAGMAVLGVLATQAFKNLVQNKLPLDTVALDAGGFRAGKYVTDRIYIGYVRRWDADPTKYQNEDEVRVEYQITSRWQFDVRYGNAQTGAANLVWSRNF
jgi:translocation and assembly module TamB